MEPAKYTWRQQVNEVLLLIKALESPQTTRTRTVRWLVNLLGDIHSLQTVEPLIARLDDPDEEMRRAVVQALGQLGDGRAVETLVARLDDSDTDQRFVVAAALQRCGDPRGLQILNTLLTSDDSEERKVAVQAFAAVRDKTVRRLLSRDLDAVEPWLDPVEPITLQRVEEAAQRLGIDESDVRTRYETLAVDLPLILEWRSVAGDAGLGTGDLRG